MRTIGAIFLSLAASAVLAQVQVEKPWVRATAPGAKVAAGYLVIRNPGAAPDRLVGAASPSAERVELHVHLREGEIVRMRPAKSFDIPAKGRFELKPGGAHLMFVDIKRPFQEGEAIPVTLTFEKAGEVRAEFHVGRLAAPPPHHKH